MVEAFIKDTVAVLAQILLAYIVSLAIRVSAAVGNSPADSALLKLHDVAVVAVVLEPVLPLAVDAVGTPLETWAPLTLQE